MRDLPIIQELCAPNHTPESCAQAAVLIDEMVTVLELSFKALENGCPFPDSDIKLEQWLQALIDTAALIHKAHSPVVQKKKGH